MQRSPIRVGIGPPRAVLQTPFSGTDWVAQAECSADNAPARPAPCTRCSKRPFST